MFEKAREAREREDWKLVIDSLQRVVEQGTATLIPATVRPGQAGSSADRAQLYESAWRLALRELAALPPEGRRAYELLYGGQAQRLVDEAILAHDQRRLRRVMRLYPLTEAAGAAFDRLSAWLIDQGAALDGLATLEEFADWSPQQGGKPVYGLRRATVLAMLGRRAEAAALLQEVRRSSDAADTERLALVTSLEASLAEGRGWQPADAAVTPPAPWRVMPAVSPPARGTAPWVHELSDESRGRWAYVRMAGHAWSLPLPLAPNYALDDATLYVRTPTQCVALDLRRLAPQWTWRCEEPLFDLFAAESRTSRGVLTRWVAECCADYVASGLTAASGRVFIIERRQEWDPPDIFAARLRFGRMFREMEPPTLRDLLGGPPNRLTALDALTGRPVWTLDAAGRASNPFQEARFLGAPLCLGEEAWLIYAQGHDLYMGIVSIADGQLVDRVHLCSVGVARSGLGAAQRPATDGQRVYAPTGHGLLLALDARDHSLQWACQYNDGAFSVWNQRAEQLSGRIGWTPGPPIAVAGRVINTPTDDNRLLVHDGRTGRVLWHTGVDQHMYVVSADEQSVWLGGKRFTCLSLADGSVRWSVLPEEAGQDEFYAAGPPGRAVHCGDEILIPTADGLIRLAAQTGRNLSAASLPGLEAPLGLLVSTGDALLSIDPHGVRKFPDVDRAYPAAQARFEAAPQDVESALRLAWLEHLRQNSARALEILEHAETDAGASADAAEVAHLRVAALIRLAADAQDAGERLRHAEAAVRTAAEPADVLETGLVLAAAKAAGGEAVAAAKALWSLCARVGAGEDAVAVDAPRVPGWRRIALEFRRIADGFTDAQKHQVRPWAESQIEQAAATLPLARDSTQERLLAAAARLDSAVAGSAAAWLALGRAALSEMRLESAEAAFRACAKLSERPAMTIEALMSLEQVYAPEALDQPFLFLEARRELEQRFKSVALPAGRSDAERGVRKVDDWLRRWQAPPAWRSSIGLPIGGAIRLVRELPPGIRGSAEQFRPMVLNIEEAAACWDDVVFLSQGRRLVSRRLDNGQFRWSCDLRLGNDFRENDDDEEDDPSQWLSRRGILLGSTLLVANREGLHAVGSRTGKRLWSHAYDLAPNSVGELPDDWHYFVADEAGVAYIPAWSIVAMRHPADGSLLWEQDLPTVPIVALRRVGDRLLAAELGFGGVYVLEASTGRLLARMLFAAQERTAPLVSGPSIVGPAPDDADTLVAYDPSDGRLLWQQRLPASPMSVFEASEDRIGAALWGGRAVLLDAATGRQVLDIGLGDSEAVTDGLLVGQHLILQHARRLAEHAQPTSLSAWDPQHGGMLWRRDDLVAAPLPRNVWSECEGRLPVLLEEEDRQARKNPPVTLAVLDIRTGRPVGPGLPLMAADAMELPLGEMTLRPGRLLVYTTGGVRVFEMTTQESAQK